MKSFISMLLAALIFCTQPCFAVIVGYSKVIESVCDDGILENGCFYNDSLSGWTPILNVIATASDGRVTLTNGAASYGGIVASETPIVAGATYNYSYTVPNGLTTRCRLFIGGVSAVRTSVAGTYTGSVVATSATSIQVQVDSGSLGASCYFDAPIKIW